MAKVYTGIGSRQTPENILEIMTNLGKKLAMGGWLLRSGGADGADSAFEKGCNLVGGSKEIYLPWPGFNNNPSKHTKVSRESLELAKTLLGPAHWSAMMNNYIRQCKEKGKIPKAVAPAHYLHARNCNQILGPDLNDKSDIVIYWAPLDGNGNPTGGTATAIRLAMLNKIPCFHLGIQSQLAALNRRIDEVGLMWLDDIPF